MKISFLLDGCGNFFANVLYFWPLSLWLLLSFNIHIIPSETFKLTLKIVQFFWDSLFWKSAGIVHVKYYLFIIIIATVVIYIYTISI